MLFAIFLGVNLVWGDVSTALSNRARVFLSRRRSASDFFRRVVEGASAWYFFHPFLPDACSLLGSSRFVVVFFFFFSDFNFTPWDLGSEVGIAVNFLR